MRKRKRSRSRGVLWLPEVAAKATRERHVCAPGRSVAWAKTGHKKKQRGMRTFGLDGDAFGVNRAKVAVGEKVDEAASNGLVLISLLVPDGEARSERDRTSVQLLPAALGVPSPASESPFLRARGQYRDRGAGTALCG